MSSKLAFARHPLAAYFGLVFALTWASVFLIGWGFRSSPAVEPTTQVALVAAPMLLVPGLVGIALTALGEGRAGLGAMWARLTRWRVGGGWYLAVAAMPLLVLAILYSLAWLVSPAYAPALSVMGLTGLVAGYLEEIGWTGFAVPRLLSRWGWLGAGLVLGGLWGLWHAAADFVIRGEALAGFWPITFALFVLPLMAWRVLMVWAYDRTHSGPVAQLLHFSYTGSLALFIPLARLTPVQDAYIYAALGVSLWCLVAVLRLWQRRLQPAPHSLRPQAGKFYG